jgi:autotransporter-associated beta strand protein
VGVGFQLRSWVQRRLRQSADALLLGMVLAAASLALTAAAQAQGFTWNGAAGVGNYILGTNWTPAGGPPVFGGQSAIFDAAGSGTVNASGGTILADSWTFNATSQSYAISGSDVNFSAAGAGGGIINNAGAGRTISISNNIGDGVGGAVQVQQLGSSTLILSGTNTYSGGTTLSAGTLQVTNTSSAGSGDVTLNGGTFQVQSGLGFLTFTNNFKVNTAGGSVDNNGLALLMLSGLVSDGNGTTGMLRLIDSSGSFLGVTVLSGPNTYSGGTTVIGTTVQVTNSSSVGSGTVTLENGLFRADGLSDLTFTNNFKINNTASGSAIDANGITLTIAGNITDGVGAGQLTVLDNSLAHSGVVVLTGTNTYTGGTTICSCGTLQLGDATHTGSIVGAVTNFGTFNIVNANTSGVTSITNDLEGGAPLPGLTTFLNATSAGTMTITNRNGGETDFGVSGGTDTATAGSATIVNRSGSFTAFFASSTAGSANITNRFHAATIFNDSSSAGSAVITTMNGGATVFTGNSNGGNAQFITNGSGVVDFTGTVGLGPVGPLGLNQITAGSIAGSGTYFIGSGNLLTVGSNNLSTEVSGVIDDGCGCGSGSLEKVGTGTLTLSGINTYTGLTLVNGGSLLVTGSIANSLVVLVDNGATLGGTGTVPQTFLSNGGTLAPGLPTALGTLTVNDALGFCSCTFYDVKVTSAGNDLTQVAFTGHPGPPGVADLAGTVRVTSLNSSYKFNSPYTILTAQGGFDFGSGPTRFDSLVTPTGINGSLSYTPTDVNLTLLSALGQLPGLNVNQHNVANALDAAFNAGAGSGGLGAIFNGNIPLNLSQASGETSTGSQQSTFNAMNLVMGLLTDPFIDGRGGSSPSSGGASGFAEEGDAASAYAAKRLNAAHDAFAKMPTKAEAARNNLFDPHWSVWGAAYGGGSTTDGNAALGSNSSTARAFGFAAGADYRISPATLVGFALAGGGTSFAVNSFGSGRSDLFQAGAFVRHNVGAAYISAAAAYGWQDVTTDRTVTVAGLDRLHAQFNANAFSGRVETGYRFVTPWMGITPYAAGQFTTFSLPAYAEQALVGTNAFALNYAAKDVTASRTELGLRTDRSFAMQNAILTLRGRAAWAHDFNTDRNIAAVFQTLPGASFVVNGAAQAHDAALTTASVEAKWLNGWSAAATFEGEFSSVTRSYAGKGVVRYTW